jgi:hypothetical protein
MRICILGAGNVGGALGEAWTRHGHEVFFGVRNPDSPAIHKVLERCGPRARAEGVADAVHSGEVIVVALPWHSCQEVLEPLALADKPLLDCTNPLKSDLSGVEVGTTTSAAEQIASWTHNSKIVKIFNSTGASNMTNANIHGEPLTMFYCGDDAESKTIAAGLAADIGFAPVDAGPLTQARVLEPLSVLAIWLAIHGGMGWDFGLQLVKR